MAPKKAKKKPSFKATAPRIAGFRPRGGTNTQAERLKLRFLQLLEEEAPSAFHEWQGLLPLARAYLDTQTYDYMDYDGEIRWHIPTSSDDAPRARDAFVQALQDWSTRNNIGAHWVLDFAWQSLLYATANPRFGPPKFRMRSTVYFSAGDSTPWIHEVQSYDGSETARDYVERTRTAFERALHEHIQERITHLRSDPEVERVVYPTEDTWRALRAVVRWQVQGDHGLTADLKTLRELFGLLDLVPRAGL